MEAVDGLGAGDVVVEQGHYGAEELGADLRVEVEVVFESEDLLVFEYLGEEGINLPEVQVPVDKAEVGVESGGVLALLGGALAVRVLLEGGEVAVGEHELQVLRGNLAFETDVVERKSEPQFDANWRDVDLNHVLYEFALIQITFLVLAENVEQTLRNHLGQARVVPPHLERHPLRALSPAHFNIVVDVAEEGLDNPLHEHAVVLRVKVLKEDF